MSSITERLAALSITPTPSSSSAVRLVTHAFKPKGGPEGTKLVLVSVEEGKELGKASGLAKKVGLGLKDLRSADEDSVREILGVAKRFASPLALTSASGPSTLLVLSTSLSSHPELSVVSESKDTDGVEHLILKGDDLKKYVESIGVKVKDLEFSEKGEESTTVNAAASGTPKTNLTATTPTAPANAASSASQTGNAEVGIQNKKNGPNFPEWYREVLFKGDMLDTYDISGCFILKPASYGIWEDIQNWFNVEIKKLGVQNASFPMFVTKKALEAEKGHIEGFEAEVAWVTRAGSKDLEEPIAIRPTSETIMYPLYHKWIRSHRDLPIRLNQWNSVVRWEFKHPQPFLRTREFLWQEGHTAFQTKAEADKEVRQILELYRKVYEDLLAVPVIPGQKSEKEKFAGGLYTTTIEGFIAATGRGIQAATSHCLGQNFSKMFDIKFEDPDKPFDPNSGKEAEKLYAWQNSWGLSTRSLGVMVMTHSDDKGLVIPPRVAQVQVVIVPTGITAKTSEEDKAKLKKTVEDIEETLRGADCRVHADWREGYTPGFKYNDWEMKGVPIRLEFGPRDMRESSVVAVRRDTGDKQSFAISSISTSIPQLLQTIQSSMFGKAQAEYDDRLKVVTEWKDFVKTLNSNCVTVIPWCEEEKCEDDIKDRSAAESAQQQEDERAPSAGAKSLCIPFNQERFGKIEPGAKCVGCGSAAKSWTMFGRSY